MQSEFLCLDSTSIKVHPDAAGAKKTSGKQYGFRKVKPFGNLKSFFASTGF